MGDAPGHFSCPFCNSYDVSRLFIASLRSDTCQCLTCGARWDEDASSGAYKDRANPSSVLFPQTPSPRDD